MIASEAFTPGRLQPFQSFSQGLDLLIMRLDLLLDRCDLVAHPLVEGIDRIHLAIFLMDRRPLVCYLKRPGNKEHPRKYGSFRLFFRQVALVNVTAIYETGH